MDDILAFLTSNDGWFAAVAAVLAMIGAVLALIRPVLARRGARPRLVLSPIEVTDPPPHTPRAEMRFQMMNVGKGAVFVRSVAVEALTRKAYPGEIVSRPAAGVHTHKAEIWLAEVGESHDILSSRYTPDAPPRHLEEGEVEAFVVAVISERGFQWGVRVVAEWYAVTGGADAERCESDVMEIAFPKAAGF